MKKNEWVIDVLRDMIEFSERNKLFKTTEALLDAEFAAYSELMASSTSKQNCPVFNVVS
ncbi:hypothetical protein [Sulfitobacter donghicola]|uniref:Uncharacterized protein n=1 Tax=Sulfitobacter donghicola DSW-25 = KCTC 12864 = JCM 14565 TaxID=1300350 RepID=A0A073IRN1_9RHOB|nr:hypothetical protein [Sulfitobacter donghicola]KEJ88022.1 hypothetical protein DSW25_04155 [Sulfitobacter donghicola DSW-25 = KCTC 12864 = JCM 14565]KIN69527.1 hypothetical protein Z948_3273 [Sulfitobacter donghicola DSW-25 = KCTC 12864 = JCM 14565]